MAEPNNKKELQELNGKNFKRDRPSTSITVQDPEIVAKCLERIADAMEKMNDTMENVLKSIVKEQ